MNLWPVALYTGTPAEKQRSTARDWRLRQLAEDPTLCHSCLSHRAGSDGGSKTLCGGCRRDRRDRYRSQYSRGLKKSRRVEKLMELAELATKRKRDYWNKLVQEGATA